jgi:hypothetical protein
MLDSWLCSVLRGAPYTCSTVWTGAGPAAARQHARLSVSELNRRPPPCLAHADTVPRTRLATGRSCGQARFRRAPAATPAPPHGLQSRTERGLESPTLRERRRNVKSAAAACHAGERPGRARRAAPACAMGVEAARTYVEKGRGLLCGGTCTGKLNDFEHTRLAPCAGTVPAKRHQLAAACK